MALSTPGLWQMLRRKLDPKKPAALRTPHLLLRPRTVPSATPAAICYASSWSCRARALKRHRDTPRAHRLMEAHWSWVIIDGERTAHLKFEAFIALLRASLLFRWLAPLMQWSPIQRFGTAVYDRVANGRGAVAAWTRWFWQPRPVRWRYGGGAPGRRRRRAAHHHRLERAHRRLAITHMGDPVGAGGPDLASRPALGHVRPPSPRGAMAGSSFPRRWKMARPSTCAARSRR